MRHLILSILLILICLNCYPSNKSDSSSLTFLDISIPSALSEFEQALASNGFSKTVENNTGTCFTGLFLNHSTNIALFSDNQIVYGIYLDMSVEENAIDFYLDLIKHFQKKYPDFNTKYPNIDAMTDEKNEIMTILGNGRFGVALVIDLGHSPTSVEIHYFLPNAENINKLTIDDL